MYLDKFIYRYVVFATGKMSTDFFSLNYGLSILIKKYNDKRSKNYYCLATTLLKIENIKENNELTIEALKNKINGGFSKTSVFGKATLDFTSSV